MQCFAYVTQKFILGFGLFILPGRKNIETQQDENKTCCSHCSQITFCLHRISVLPLSHFGHYFHYPFAFDFFASLFTTFSCIKATVTKRVLFSLKNRITSISIYNLFHFIF